MASFIKVSTFLAIIASLQQLTVATPPACLLACVAQVQKSSTQCSGLNDLSCICSNEGDDIKTCLDNICPNGDADAAKKAFSNSCSGHDDGSSNSSSSSSKAESSSTASSSAEGSSSSAEASSSSSSEAKSSSEAAPSGSSSVAAPSSSAAASSTTGGGAGGHESSAEPSSTLHTSTVAAQSSSSSSEVPAVSTQPGGSGASKVGLGALIGLVGAALL